MGLMVVVGFECDSGKYWGPEQNAGQEEQIYDLQNFWYQTGQEH